MPLVDRRRTHGARPASRGRRRSLDRRALACCLLRYGGCAAAPRLTIASDRGKEALPLQGTAADRLLWAAPAAAAYRAANCPALVAANDFPDALTA